MDSQAATRPRTHSDYTVGWVCALPKEQTAATAMLDYKHDNLSKPPSDHNTYTLGSIGNHNIVIACLPKGEIGTNSAATVATQMADTFPSIKIGLMVGIGGGIPPKVRLGDVVISSPVGKYSGVVQWDLGKALEGGNFERTGSLNSPPASLRTALTKLETDHEMNGHKIFQYLEDVKCKWPNLSLNYTSRDHLKDPLDALDDPYRSRTWQTFLSAFWETILALVKFLLGWWTLANTEPGTEQVVVAAVDNAVERGNGKSRDFRVHYGLIASGNQVIKAAALRDRLNQDFDGQVLCVEMEAAGLMNNFPCIVVRGICDYADSHKNDDWQEYAATVAAAFAKELLQHVQTSEVDGERPVNQILTQVLTTVSTTAANVAQVDAKLERHRDTEILDWLTQVNYGPQHSDYCKSRQPGTGIWLLESREFQDWLNTSQQTLFCPGIPGAGKTILTSIVIDDLTSRYSHDPKTAIVYMYCNFKRQIEQRIDDLFASVLKQLANGQVPMPDSVKKLYDNHRAKKTRPSLDEILKTIHSVAALYSRIFTVIDALDECQTSDGCRPRFLSELFDMQKRNRINIFATSRFIPDIMDHFKSDASLEIKASTKDVAKYIDGYMRLLPSVVQQDQNLQQEIRLGISEAVDGMFLLAQIYLSLLNDKLTPNEIRNAMEVFPKQSEGQHDFQKIQVLENAYKQAMERINGQMPRLKKLAMEVLLWITCVNRQITTSELRHALATKKGKNEIDIGDFLEIEDMVSACAGLVTVDNKSGIIRLVHYTTQQYLEKTKGTWFPDAESHMTTICVTYLSFSVFETGCCETKQSFEERLRQHPLYEYAARNWGYHARKDATTSQIVITFLQSKAQIEASTQVLMVDQKRSSWDETYSEDFPKNMTGLHLAAYFGLSKVAHLLLEAEQNPNPKDTYSRKPLWYAARRGNGDVVELLLTSGADTNDAAGASLGERTVLQAAAEGGHIRVVEKLLAAGADINAAAAGLGGRTALQAAAEMGHLELVDKLLAAGADINAAAAAEGGGRTALQAAAERGHAEVVDKLLEAGADINAAATAAGWGGRTALQAAAEGGHLELIDKLLAAGADINAAATAEGEGRTALQAAAERGHLEVVDKLLAAGADINAAAVQDGGRTALQAAARGGHLEVIDKLLAAGADINAAAAAAGWGGRTALQAAADEGNLEVVDKLLAAGADINAAAAAEGGGRTALQAAAEKGHAEVVDKLLEAGADINAAATAEGEGRTALQAAAERGHLELVDKLLAAGADINAGAAEGGGRTALQAAAEKGHVEVVDKLLEAGADINAATAARWGGRTALQAAAQWRHIELVDQLLAAGADINTAAAEGGGRTALQAAAEMGHLELVDKLLEAGADINAATAAGWGGRTALQAAAEMGHLEVVDKLLAVGADINAAAAGLGGRTALQAAAERGNPELVDKLLAAGADINAAAAGWEGRTALQAASEEGYLQVFEKLLAA